MRMVAIARPETGRWNIAIPTGGAVSPISIALSVSGEPLASATAIVTPAAVEDYFNVFTAVRLLFATLIA